MKGIMTIVLVMAGLQFAFGALPYDREWDANAWTEAKADEPAASNPSEQVAYWEDILAKKLATSFNNYNDSCMLRIYWKRASLNDYTGLAGKIDQVLAKGGASPFMVFYLRQAKACIAFATGDADTAITESVWLFNNFPAGMKSEDYYRLLRETTYASKKANIPIPNQSKLYVSALTTVPVQVVSTNFIAAYDSLPMKDLTVDEYVTFLKGVLKITPAIEANAQFLGRVKSELEKMQ